VIRSATYLLSWATVCSLITLLSARAEAAITVQPLSGKFRVLVGDQLFCEVDYQGYAKPIVYPILGPDQIPLTRNHPMQPGVKGEATDHPHHKSMWFAHGDVNGVSFWDEKGKIVTEEAQVLEAADGTPMIRLDNRLVDPKGTQVCTETVLYRFGADDATRWIDWDITMHAGDQPLTFGDTKEGTAAIRVHPNLQLENDPERGVTTAAGTAINSEGVAGPAVWGKRARWVDFSGVIDDHPVGIAFFDHPQNHGYPTYWHARGYGLFAANPFGASQFVGAGANGSHTVPAGTDFRLRYRLVFHRGDAQQSRVAERFEQYRQAAQP